MRGSEWLECGAQFCLFALFQRLPYLCNHPLSAILTPDMRRKAGLGQAAAGRVSICRQ